MMCEHCDRDVYDRCVTDGEVITCGRFSAQARQAQPVQPISLITNINELAKVYASSYASPHHITFTLNGLRNMVRAIFTAQLEQTAAQHWRNFCETCGQRLGDADHIHTCSLPTNIKVTNENRI